MEMQHLKELELIFLKFISLEKYKIVDNKLVFNFDLLQPLIADNERDCVKSLSRIEKELGINITLAQDEKHVIVENKLIDNPFTSTERSSIYTYNLFNILNSKSMSDTCNLIDTNDIFSPLSKGRRLIISNQQSHILNLLLTFNDMSLKKVNDYLSGYIKQFENGNLRTIARNYYKKETHFELLMKVLSSYKDLEPKNLYIPGSTVYSYAQSIPTGKHDFFQYRPIEYIMLMEQKKHLVIKDITVYKKQEVNNIGNNKNSRIQANFLPPFIPWGITVDLLRTPEEIKSVEGYWTKYGPLALREDVMLARNGEVEHNFSLDQKAFKALQWFAVNPEQDIHSTRLEELIGEKGQSATEEQTHSRMNDFVSKRIRKPLKLNEPGSKVKIAGSDGTFKLIYTP
ncbi:MAG: hypothetical protein HY094_01985 [Candidatus Melainabacteria bacterium]|nr:hypothetical protein [Candidatus Melainabacteria bacterium]